MHQFKKSNRPQKGENDLLKRTSGELAALIAELQSVNSEIQESRRAALNMMEDAILSKEALRKSEEKYRLQLEQEVQHRTAELEKANEQIRDQSRYIQRITETVPDMISVTNLETKEFEYLNKETFKAQGFDPAEMQAKSPEERMAYVHDDDRPALADYFQKLSTASDTDIITAEYRAKGSHNRWEWFLVRGKAFQRNQTGAVTHVVNVIENITERKQAEQEVLRLKDAVAQKATDRYLTLFNSIDEAVVWCELITGEDGKAIDYRMLELNPAFEKMTGITVESAKGKTAREVVPTLEDWWFETYARVALRGEIIRFENKVEELERWFDVYASPMGNREDKQFVIVYKDITERKRSEQRQEFLLKLMDGLRPLAEPVRIQAVAAQLTGEYLNANLVHYAETDGDYVIIRQAWANGVEPVRGSVPHEAYGKRLIDGLRSGKTQVCCDVHTDPTIRKEERALLSATKILAYVAVPLIKKGEWVATLAVHVNQPRNWKPNEIELIEEIAERTWAAAERTKAEEALRESEERLRITTESAVDYSIITMNTERVIEAWSKGAELTFGYTAEEAIGKPGDIIFTEEDQAAGIPQKEMETARTEGRAEDERWHRRKDGSRFYMSGVMRPILSDNLSGYVKVARDMTQQKQAEETLKLSEERYRIALQSASMAAWDWNVAEDTIMWNEQHYLMLGLKPSSQKKDLDFFMQYVHEYDKKRIKEALLKAVQETGSFEAEYRMCRADNNEARWVNGYGRVVAKNGQQATRMVGVMFDITERKMLEQQKDDFIGIASHELRTPVTSIKAYTEILQELLDESGDEISKDLVMKLDKQVDRFAELIRALLDITKITEGQFLLKASRFDINELIAERIEELQHTTDKHRIIQFSDAPATITADRQRIGEVLTNFISNAIKYAPKGGDIIVTSRHTAEGVQVSVKDNGVGIPEHVKEKVFERFYRVRNATIDTFPGMGLGLYIAANIIHQHKGRVWLESELGAGSTFFFVLPPG